MHNKPPIDVSRRALLQAATLMAASPALARQPAADHPQAHGSLGFRPVKVAVKPGAAASQMIGTIDGYPCRLLRLKKGEKFEIVLHNDIGEPTAVQIHGSRGANSAEQIALNAQPLGKGNTRSVHFDAPDAGSFLYLPVLQGKSSEQRERGLAGMIVVEEPDAQPVDLDLVAILDDIRLNSDGAIEPVFNARLDAARFGRLGNALLCNGKVAPEEITVRPNARVRLRLGNVANARIMPLKFQGGVQTVVAIDGQACDPFDPLKRAVVLLPGSRYEVMLDMPAEADKEAGVLVETASLHKVLNFKTLGEPLPPRPPVKPLPANAVPPSIRLQNAARSEVSISGGLDRTTDVSKPLPTEDELARRWPDRTKIYQINQGFSQGFTGKPIISVKRGTPVVLALTNRTAWSQVLTIHGHVFRLLHPLDDGWEPYFLDTIHLSPLTTSRIAFDAVNPGRWAIRSTIAEHFDAGVATWFEVT